MKRAIVVGASSGIGAALVRALAAEGAVVAGLARRREALEAVCGPVGARAIVHDVAELDTVPAAFAAADEAVGGADALFVCAGIMPIPEPGALDAALDARTLQVNLLGAVAWLDAAGEAFIARRAGVLVAVGSVAGDRGRPPYPAYGASKAGLHAFCEGLRGRLRGTGVDVVVVKPGPVDTPMVAGRGGLPLLVSAEEAAATTLRAARQRSRVRYVHQLWAPIMAVIRALPGPVFDRLKL